MEGEDVRALRGVSLEIEDNEYVAIMGPFRLGQVDPDEHHRLSRRADLGQLLLEGIDVSGDGRG